MDFALEKSEFQARFEPNTGRFVASRTPSRSRLILEDAFNYTRRPQDLSDYQRRIPELLATAGWNPLQARIIETRESDVLEYAQETNPQELIRYLELLEKQSKLTEDDLNLCGRVILSRSTLPRIWNSQNATQVISLAERLLRKVGIDPRKLNAHNYLLAPLKWNGEEPSISKPIEPIREGKDRDRLLTLSDWYDANRLCSVRRIGNSTLKELGKELITELGYKSEEEFGAAIAGKTVIDLGSGLAVANKFAELIQARANLWININPAIFIAREFINRQEQIAITGTNDDFNLICENINDQTRPLYWDEANAQRLGLEEGSVDLIISNYGFPQYAQTTDEVEIVLKNAYELLKPGGEFRISPISNMGELIPDCFKFNAADRFKALLNGSGFEIAELKPNPNDWSEFYIILRKPKP